MTVREYLVDRLIDNGMFESQAKEVVESAIPELNSMVDDYKITFDRPAKEYPAILLKLFYANLRPIALKWIDKNAPQAWFRPMFVD